MKNKQTFIVWLQHFFSLSKIESWSYLREKTKHCNFEIILDLNEDMLEKFQRQQQKQNILF